ncbi:MAG: hypothetical protein WBV06_19965 [Acidimicrobiia bacterium]
MPGWTKLAIGWVVAAALAVTLSWTAVAQVRDRVIRPSIAIPTTTLATQAAAGTATSTVIRLDPESTTSSPRNATTTSALAPATTVPSTTPPSHSTTSTSAAGSESQPTTTAAPPATTTTTTTPTTTTPTTTTPTTTTATSQTTSYELSGGVVTISYSPGVVEFVSAIPQPGFSTDIRNSGPEEVRVRFESPTHTSEFRARWNGGQLEITKDENGGG